MHEGDKVKITVEAEIVRVDGSNCLKVRSDAVSFGEEIHVCQEFAESVEHLEPDFEINDIVRDANGNVFVRYADGTWLDIDDRQLEEENFPVRPLTLIVRDAEPVA